MEELSPDIFEGCDLLHGLGCGSGYTACRPIFLFFDGDNWENLVSMFSSLPLQAIS
jgi:hypothetical protein